MNAILIILLVSSLSAHAQLRIKVVYGSIGIDDGSLTPNEKKYAVLTDSLDRNLKIHSNDTTSLFLRALLYLRYNSLIAKPYSADKIALENLEIAKKMAERAISLNMKNFNLKILRAQIYKELIYRFAGDESWKYNSKQIAERRELFNSYKELANKCYDDLAEMDKRNTYDYQQLKVGSIYP